MTSAKGRILILTSNFPRWTGDSVTPFVLHLAHDLTALGWEVDVLAPHAVGAARNERWGAIGVARFQYWWPASRQQLCYNGGALVNLRTRPLARLQVLPFVVAQIAATLWRMNVRRYDLVHSHWILPQGLAGWVATRLFRRPNVVTVHGGDIFGLKGKWMRRAKRFALARATHVTVNSSFTQAAVARLIGSPHHISQIAMGVSDHPRPQADRVATIRAQFPAGLLVAFVGRLVPEKGPSDAIEAIAMLGRDGMKCSLMVIGDGPSRGELEALADALQITSRVHFVGWLEGRGVSDYLAAADVFVGPSRTAPDGWVEAQGLTFAEAMIAGVPVIATRSGGIPDTVQHEKTGLLVDEQAPLQIAAAIKRLWSDPAFAADLAENALLFAREHRSRAASARRFDELFTRLCQDRPSFRTDR